MGVGESCNEGWVSVKFRVITIKTTITTHERFWSCNTSQQDFGTRKVYCVSNVTFHAESKYAIKIFFITHSFCTMAF